MEDFSLFFFDFVQYFFRIFAFLCKIGVSHRSTELVLVTALRSFVDDLLRRCVANKMKSNTGNRYEISFSKNAKIDFSSIFNDLLIYLFFFFSPIFPFYSANAHICNDDILQTISQIPQFDFLTNKNLGSESNKSTQPS